VAHEADQAELSDMLAEGGHKVRMSAETRLERG
jgi:hypothetical protein